MMGCGIGDEGEGRCGWRGGGWGIGDRLARYTFFLLAGTMFGAARKSVRASAASSRFRCRPTLTATHWPRLLLGGGRQDGVVDLSFL